MPYIFAAVFLIGIGSGFSIKSVLVKAENSEKLQSALTQLNDSKKYNNELIKKLDNQSIKTKIITKTIIKRIPEYVPKIQKTDSECNINDATKRMLNKLVNMH